MHLALRSQLLRVLALIAASVAVAVVSGCGDSESGSETATPVESTPASTEESTTADESTDEAKGETDAGKATAALGKQLFSSAGCVSCHTLADSGASGRIGPNLDDEQPSADVVNEVVTNGDGRMPSFKDNLSPDEIAAVAEYVSSVAGQ